MYEYEEDFGLDASYEDRFDNFGTTYNEADFDYLGYGLDYEYRGFDDDGHLDFDDDEYRDFEDDDE